MGQSGFSYLAFSPDRVFACLNAEGETGYALSREIFTAEIQPCFDEYIETMALEEEYGGIADAFADPQGQVCGVFAPDDFDEFVIRLADHYADERPEWDDILIQSGLLVCSEVTPSTPPQEFIKPESVVPIVQAAEECPLEFADSELEAFDVLDSYKKLPPAEFVAKITSVLDTPETFDEFAAAYLVENRKERLTPSFDQATVLALRKHGRGLYGHDVREKSLEERFGIDIESEDKGKGVFYDLKNDGPDYVYDRIPVAELTTVYDNIERFFASYPNAFLQSVSLRRLGLFTNILDPHEGAELLGYAKSHEVIVSNGAINILHHETFHAADFSDGLTDDDASWALQNHGPNYETALFFASDANPPSGFASWYGLNGNRNSRFEKQSRTLGFQEDQAELAEALWTQHDTLLKRASDDPILAGKIKAIKGFYYARSAGLMDEKFWSDVARGVRIDSDYWNERQWREVVRERHFPETEEFVQDAAGEKLKKAWLAETSVGEIKYPWNAWQGIGIYSGLVSSYPGNPHYEKRLAESYFYTLRWNDSLDHYENAIRKGSRDPQVYARVAYLLSPGWGGGCDGTVAFYERLIAEGVRNPYLVEELAGLYLKADRSADAVMLYRMQIDACRIDGEYDQDFLYYFAEFLKRQGAELTRKDLNMAYGYIVEHAEYQKSAAAFFAIVEVLRESGREAEALKILENAGQKSPLESYLQGRLVQVREEVKQQEAEKAKLKGPGSPWPADWLLGLHLLTGLPLGRL